jgi:hypothetical protein
MKKLLIAAMAFTTVNVFAEYNVQPPDLIYPTYTECPVSHIKEREIWVRYNVKNLTQDELNNMVAGLQTELNVINVGCEKKAKAAADQAKAEEHRKSLPNARLGMSTKQVIERTNMGKPEKINRTVGRWGVHEQWVYDDGSYLYFENGKLTSWQD